MSSYGKSLRLLGEQLLFISRYVRQHPLLLAVFPFLIAVDIAFDIGIAKMQGFFIDTAHSGTAAELAFAIRWTAFLLTAAIGLLVTHRYSIRLLRGLVQRDLSVELFRSVNEQTYKSMQLYHSGDIVTRIREDTGSGADIVEAAIEFVTVIVIIGASFIYLLTIDIALALFALIGAPLLLLVGRVFDRQIEHLSAAAQVLEGEIRGMTQEMLQGMNVVRIYGLSDRFLKGIADAKEQLVHVRRKLDMTRSLSANLTETVFYLLHIGALLLISLAAVRGTLTPGTIATFSLLFELVIWPIIGMSNQWSRLYEGAGAFGRIQELLSRREPNVRVDGGGRAAGALAERANVEGTLIKVKGEAVESEPCITMGQVTYRPNPDASPIIDNIDFMLRQGEVVAVVGSSGAGKSTFAALCSGLLQPTAGDVTASRSLAEHDRRDTIYLAQQPYLYTGTVSENIRLSAAAATDDDITAAARKACIHDEIERLAYKYDTEIGERGGSLSGGQRQRIGLSRLYVHEPDLIIMDEPTSALDASTEHRVMLEIGPWLSGRTAVIVTHRLELASTLAHRIIVMEQGRIVEEGTHEQLIRQGGRYKTMHSQSRTGTENDEGFECEAIMRGS
jgi:ABC-type multidrug transport system fused ATPase/permease subunit